MDFATQTQAASTDVNFFMIIMIILLFISNFAFCRFMSIKMVTAGYIRKHPVLLITPKKGKARLVANTKVTNEDYKKLFFFWFVPIVGALGLTALYISIITTIALKNAKHKLFLNHI